MEFKQFKTDLQKHFEQMSKDADVLFEVEIDKDKLWDLYLNSFPEGKNKVFRKRKEHDCSCCRHFIKNIGNVVALKDGKITTIWDFKTNSTYQPSIDAMAKYVLSNKIVTKFVGVEKKVGTDYNHELYEGETLTWDHLFLELPNKFLNNSSKSINDVKGTFRDIRNVFERSLNEISQEAISTVLELINSNTLYKGAEWHKVLLEFSRYKKAYDKLKTKKAKELYVWEQTYKAGVAIGKIKNHSIGTLLVNITEGMDLDMAVKKYESIVAPTNYKRPKAIFTKKMIEEAQNKITELDYLNSLGRRFATIDDISVNNILFSNKDAAKKIQGATSVFDDLMSNAKSSPKKFSKAQEISIEDFIKNVLPTTQDLEVYFEGKHANNLVSLIAPKDKTAKSMFKWNNPYCWAYKGNITDSDIKENVKMAGGNTNGVMRFSIQWNDGEYDGNDLDAHCKEPGGYEIYFGNKREYSPCKGMLDVDIIHPTHGTPAVENIVWESRNHLKNGTYKMFVNCYSNRGGRNGFKAELEIEGETYSFEYNNTLRQDEDVYVAEVTYNAATGFTVNEKLSSSNVSSKEIWGLTTNQFVPVSVMMFSPNYWDEQKGIGHKHYLFMIKDCINDEQPNGFYNEFLKSELEEHKRVFEALGSKMKVEDSDEQLSGLGFSSTKRNDVVVKVKGSTERIFKIKF